MLLLSNSAEIRGKGTVTEEVMNECAHSWQSDLSLPNDNACDLDEGHEKATSGGISFSFLSWGLFPLSSSLSGRAGDVHSDLLLHDALHASAFHGQLLGDGSQGCDEGTFRGESSRYYWSSSTMLHVDDYFYIALSFLSFIIISRQWPHWPSSGESTCKGSGTKPCAGKSGEGEISLFL